MTKTLSDSRSTPERRPGGGHARDARARDAALEILHDTNRAPVPVVVYRSEGHLLVHSSEPLESELTDRILDTGLKCTFLISRADANDVALKESGGNSDLLEGRVATFAGHLGDFRITLVKQGGDIDAGSLCGLRGKGFDLVLDLAGGSLVRQEVYPVGYFAPGSEDEFYAALEEIPQLLGEFEKPKYFRLDPEACAHTARGIVACTRCLDVCPTLAISAGKDSIEVDPYACQGIGICTTVCPTGAISYGYPRASDLLDDLRRMLHRYHAEKGKRPVLLFHDDASGRKYVRRIGHRLPGNLIPVEVESVAAVGLEVWLSCLAYGAHHVLLLMAGDLPSGIAEPVGREIEVAGIILGAMGYPSDRITMLSACDGDSAARLPAKFGKKLVTPAGFAGFDDKRTALRLALDHFTEHAPKEVKTVALPRGSGFGRVAIDRDGCTLCMSCAAVCPTAALQSGGEAPRLLFLERNCVQCGMCEKACPEDVIGLEARFNFDAREGGAEAIVVKEEEPFNCVKCGRPFSTQTMMDRIREKLSGHWMYQDESQLRRLEMCEDCRVEDLFSSAGGLDVQTHGAKPGGSKVE
jgi:ferredoxin